MLSLASLWLPWLVAAVLVFVASSLIHMVFRWHASDYRKLPDEDAVRAALKGGSLPAGQYTVPHCGDMKDMQSPEMQQKFREGPVAMLLVRAPGLPAMGPMLGQWFALNLLVSGIVACVLACTLAPGAEAHRVLHLAALIGFIAYAGGSISDGIWKGQPWGAVAKDLLDALIYGAATGGAYALLWPAAT